jgi:hypothetical protein
MLRTGLGVAFSLALGWRLGGMAAAVPAAACANLLLFVDPPAALPRRLLALALAAAALPVAAMLGARLDGGALYLATLLLGLAAGVLQQHALGLGLIVRQALIALLIGAFLAQAGMALPPTAWLAGPVVIAVCTIEGLVRPREAGPAGGGVPLPFGLWYGIAAAAALLFAGELGATRPFWVTITVLVVMQPDRQASLLRAGQRLAGTLAGVVLAFAVAATARAAGTAAPLAVALIALPFLWPLGFARSNPAGVALISCWILVLLDLATPERAGEAALFLARLVDTALGCALAALATLLTRMPLSRR